MGEPVAVFFEMGHPAQIMAGTRTTRKIQTFYELYGKDLTTPWNPSRKKGSERFNVCGRGIITGNRFRINQIGIRSIRKIRVQKKKVRYVRHPNPSL
jgi:hypothetical protein